MLKYVHKPDLPAAGRSGEKICIFTYICAICPKCSFREECLCVCRHLHIYAAIMQAAAIITPAFSQSSCRAENSGGDVSSCIGNQLGLLQTNAVATRPLLISAGAMLVVRPAIRKTLMTCSAFKSDASRA